MPRIVAETEGKVVPIAVPPLKLVMILPCTAELPPTSFPLSWFAEIREPTKTIPRFILLILLLYTLLPLLGAVVALAISATVVILAEVGPSI